MSSLSKAEQLAAVVKRLWVLYSYGTTIDIRGMEDKRKRFFSNWKAQ